MRKLLALSLLLVLALMFGCAPPSVAGEDRGSSASNIDKAPSDAAVDTNALFLKAGESFIHIDNQRAVICEEDAANASTYGAQLVAQLKQLDGGRTIYAVIARNGTYEAHVAEKPLPRLLDSECTGPNGGTSWTFRWYQEPDAGFLSSFSLTSAFSSLVAIGGETRGCEGGGSVSMTFKPQLQAFKVAHGKLQAPSFSLELEAEAAAEGSARCFLTKSSGPKVAMVGFIPVLYEVELTVDVQLKVSQATTISAKLGTGGGTMSVRAADPELSLTPKIELGVKFYGVIGAVVGVDFPITAEFPFGRGCMPELSMRVSLHAGVSSVIGGSSVSAALGYEISADILGPYKIISSRCTEGPAPEPSPEQPVFEPAPVPAPAPAACACLGGRGLGDVDLGPVSCGTENICGQDGTVWACSTGGVWSNPGQACGP